MKKQISIIGGGPSALLLAACLDETKFDVTIYEKNKSLGRKFLVAGKGGFNLTHSEPITKMIEHYTPSDFLKNALLKFTNLDLQSWLSEIGIPTFIGSSKRIYPHKSIKPIEVLNAILKVLQQKNVTIKYEHKWIGWGSNDSILFKTNENEINLKPNYVVFALGGGSWKVTGSDGSWLSLFKKKGVEISDFQSSNCAFKVDWDKTFIKQNEGKPLKNIAISCDGKTQKGEVVITQFGLEGNAIYALSPQIRQHINQNQIADIYLDLKPTSTVETIMNKIRYSKFKNTTQILKNDLKFNAVQMGLIKTFVSKSSFMDLNQLAKEIKTLKISITGLGGLDKAISTVGGISLNAVNSNFELKTLKNQYCIGEMLNWDAPTGGYLLQACFSMGVTLSENMNN